MCRESSILFSKQHVLHVQLKLMKVSQNLAAKPLEVMTSDAHLFKRLQNKQTLCPLISISLGMLYGIQKTHQGLSRSTAPHVLGWSGPAVFSVARLFHFTEKLEQLGSIRDFIPPNSVNKTAQGAARCGMRNSC